MILSIENQCIDRMAPAFKITHTDDFTAQNIEVRHAGGMGIIVENSSYLLLNNFNVTASNGRVVSTRADTTHFIGCRGTVTLRNCTLNNMLDDGLKLHGVYQEIVDIRGDRKIGVRMRYSQQQGFSMRKANETLGVLRLKDSFFPFDSPTNNDIQKINGRYHIETLNKKLPPSVKVGDLVEKLDTYPELLVENCTIGKYRVRVILLSDPKKSALRNKTFSAKMESILIPVDSGHLFEAGNAANLTIKNNIFQDARHSGFDRGAIRFVTDDKNENIAFKNIEIIGNTFNHFDNLILEIANSDGLLFNGNSFTDSSTFQILHRENQAIKAKPSKNIKFQKNKYNGKAQQRIETDGSIPKLKFR